VAGEQAAAGRCLAWHADPRPGAAETGPALRLRRSCGARHYRHGGPVAEVRTRPPPFPPGPLRLAVIQLTRIRLAAADQREGPRGLWLGALDRPGPGFDS
jgi:hypothetical protein